MHRGFAIEYMIELTAAPSHFLKKPAKVCCPDFFEGTIGSFFGRGSTFFSLFGAAVAFPLDLVLVWASLSVSTDVVFSARGLGIGLGLGFGSGLDIVDFESCFAGPSLSGASGMALEDELARGLAFGFGFAGTLLGFETSLSEATAASPSEADSNDQ